MEYPECQMKDTLTVVIKNFAIILIGFRMYMSQII